jgi:small subunit ribosomal protein S18
VSSGPGRSFSRRKVCGFCVEGIKHVDYKDVPRMRRYISDRGMIEPRRKTGTCAKHQRSLAIAIKRARHLALVSYTEGSREGRDRGGRGERGGRFRDRDRGPRDDFRGGPRDESRGPRDDFRGPHDDFHGSRDDRGEGRRDAGPGFGSAE